MTLLHVISPVLWGTGDGPAAPPPTYLDAIEADAQQGIEDALTRVRVAGLDGQALVAYGAPFDRIITTACQEGVDLIVMGTHGRSGLPHLLMGSVAERVVRLAPCPVLVTRGTVPPGEET